MFARARARVCVCVCARAHARVLLLLVGWLVGWLVVGWLVLFVFCRGGGWKEGEGSNFVIPPKPIILSLCL